MIINYLGLTDKGEWEKFEWDDAYQAPTAENTGYEEVKKA